MSKLGGKGIPTKEWSKDVTVDYEPYRSFRYVVKLPENFDILKEAVQEIHFPIIIKNFFRKNYSDCQIKVINFVKPCGLKGIHDNINMKNFDIVVELLDPHNVAISKMIITCSKIHSIDYGNLSYVSDNLHQFFVRFKVKSIKYENVNN